ncbi:MAG: MlaD family protein, partial [Bacteroidia bacterium]
YMKRILSDINNGEGAIGAAIHDTMLRRNLLQTITDMELASHSIKQSSQNLQLITQKIDTGNGAIATLINDTTFASNLKKTVVSAKESAEKLNQNMEALKSNFLFRPYFRKQEKAKRKNN